MKLCKLSIDDFWKSLAAISFLSVNVKVGRIPQIDNRQSKNYNAMLGHNAQFFEYGIHNLHYPDSLFSGGIPDTGASDAVFGTDQQFKG